MLAAHAEFSLVWRDQLHFNEKATRVRTDLAALEVNVKRTVRWPGTRLLKGAGVATVVRYRCSPAALPVLNRPGRLFGWVTPDFPEDLSFYAADGSCTFASISHEGEAWVFSDNVLATVTRFAEAKPHDVQGEAVNVLLGVV